MATTNQLSAFIHTTKKNWRGRYELPLSRREKAFLMLAISYIVMVIFIPVFSQSFLTLSYVNIVTFLLGILTFLVWFYFRSDTFYTSLPFLIWVKIVDVHLLSMGIPDPATRYFYHTIFPPLVLFIFKRNQALFYIVVNFIVFWGTRYYFKVLPDFNIFITSFAYTLIPTSLYSFLLGDIEKFETELKKLGIKNFNLANSILHDFRNIIGIVSVRFSIFEEKIKSNPIAEEEMKKVTYSLDRLINFSNILSRLLKSQMTFAQNDRVDIRDIFQEQKILFEKIAQKKEVDLIFNHEGDPHFSSVYEILTFSILPNLISNSIRHSPHGGKIFIHYKNKPHQFLIELIDEAGGVPQEILEALGQWEGPISQNADQPVTGMPEKMAFKNATGHGQGLLLVKYFSTQIGLEFKINLTAKGSRFVLRHPPPENL